MSTRMGSVARRGAAKATGSVPNNALLPPQGAIASGELAKKSPTSPARANRSTGCQAAPA